MPGAEYQITCTSCELPPGSLTDSTMVEEIDPDWVWPATLGEFFGERGGFETKYCSACGYLAEHRHFFKLVCGDCGRRERRFATMTTPADQCTCGGVRTVQLIHGRLPTCPDHPDVPLVDISLIELGDVKDGVTSIPCRRCGSGRLVIGGTVTLMD
ncbi:MAG: hypothetical protein KDC46_16430 [Thermoleophilia bacterium]|nr:hypothetical protein [Thermoleophilia bacterium]